MSPNNAKMYRVRREKGYNYSTVVVLFFSAHPVHLWLQYFTIFLINGFSLIASQSASLITGDEKDSYTLEDQDFEYDSNAEDDLSIGDDDYYEEDIDEQKDIPVSFYNALVLNEVSESKNVLTVMNLMKLELLKNHHLFSAISRTYQKFH